MTLSVKATRQTADQFWAIAEQNAWKAGETFEKVVAALQREASSRPSSDT